MSMLLTLTVVIMVSKFPTTSRVVRIPLLLPRLSMLVHRRLILPTLAMLVIRLGSVSVPLALILSSSKLRMLLGWTGTLSMVLEQVSGVLPMTSTNDTGTIQIIFGSARRVSVGSRRTCSLSQGSALAP